MLFSILRINELANFEKLQKKFLKKFIKKIFVISMKDV